MQQPELGRRLTALRKEKNLTQEDLVQKSNVSVRTIQRIENGEVLPRMATVKILLEALGEDFESFSTKIDASMETEKTGVTDSQRNAVLTAAIAGAIYLAAEIILGAMDLSWLTGERHWGIRMNVIYTGLTMTMVVSFILFARGFIVLSTLFENTLLRIAAYCLIVAVAGMGALDVISLSESDIEQFWAPYAAAAVLTGAVTIVFGVSLIKLQDGMGELSRVVGILEIALGCMLATVVLFFVAYVIMVPTVVLEILLLYRAYEYLSKPPAERIAPTV